MPNVNTFATLAAAAKKAAREELRAKAYLALTGTIYRLKQSFNKTIDSLKKEFDEVEKDAKRLEVEANALPTEHPDRADRIKEAEESRKDADKRKTEIEKEIATLTEDNDKAVAEQEKELKAIEAGESKVDYDAVLKRAEKLIALRIRAQHDNGDFDTQETA